MDDNLPPRIKYWLNEANHDCFFVVGPENGPKRRIGAIKILLMGDSEPFRAMLQDSELAEKGDIRVTDVEPEMFRNFLKCVYGASSFVLPKLSFEECTKLLYVIEKYLVKGIKTELTKHMSESFTFENVFIALSHPICCQTSVLQSKILDVLKYDFKKVTTDKKFLELNPSAIKWILQIQFLLVKEIEIWNAVIRWAKHKTGSSDGTVLRFYILGLLKYIRFLTMDYIEFRESVLDSGILLNEEVNDICRALVTGQPCTTNHLCTNRNNRYNLAAVSNHINSSFIESPCLAFIHCSITSVSDLQSHHHTTETYHWAGHLWCLDIGKEYHKKKYHLGVYLWCHGKSHGWNCTVDVEISLINQSKKPHINDKYTKKFNTTLENWGFFLYEWNDLVNPEKGFIKGNRIIVLARIQLKNT